MPQKETLIIVHPKHGEAVASPMQLPEFFEHGWKAKGASEEKPADEQKPEESGDQAAE